MASTDWLSQGTLVLASNNKGKIAEFEKLFAELNLPVEVIAQGKLNIEEAIERAGTKAGNKGSEAAFGAIEMVNLIKNIG